MKKRQSGGFTLIELLIVVAIIGIVAAILLPNLLDALQKARQKRTMADMRNVGTVWFSWLSDQAGAAASGATQLQLDWTKYTLTSYTELRDTLVPQYSAELPERDGWRGAYEFGSLDIDQPLAIAIRSAAADGAFEATTYTFGAFVATDYNHDIVWAGGFFVQWPGGVIESAPANTP